MWVWVWVWVCGGLGLGYHTLGSRERGVEAGTGGSCDRGRGGWEDDGGTNADANSDADAGDDDAAPITIPRLRQVSRWRLINASPIEMPHFGHVARGSEVGAEVDVG